MNHEPIDEPTPTPILVSRSKFEQYAGTVGSLVELTADAYFVTFNERVYYTPRRALKPQPLSNDEIAAMFDAWLTANPGRPLTDGEQRQHDIARDHGDDLATARDRRAEDVCDAYGPGRDGRRTA